MNKDIILQLSYLLASVLFILGIKRMGKTSTARSGNRYSALAMLIAILATLANNKVLTFTEILVGIAIGSAIGVFAAIRVPMTSMPEMVAIFNGVGGLASLFVALSEFWNKNIEMSTGLDPITLASVVMSILIGAVTFTGSYIAYGKLSGTISGKAIVFTGQHPINLILFLIAISSGVYMVLHPTELISLYVLVGISLALGVLTVIPIGGADMPVVISLLNSYSGMAAAATGFILNNNVLVISGALVGSSGIILTNIMCVAMNRSLVSVLLGGFGQVAGTDTGASSGSSMAVREIGVEETAMLFDSASSVIFVPGYGMAVAQAQHVIRELTNKLEAKGVSVKFAIHPVAGRMPGHMNVLLAEAEVPYDKLIEMDDINPEFPNTDIVMVIGANDIVNPAARHNKQSPIYGMPILNADKAKTVIISKRSMAAGYAGIENELFGYPNAFMLFGDAKATISKVSQEIDNL
ncbi:MAG: NAD(P)(+) transhydrogenase (Re/Si-specific) subunit beta [Leptospiraceae bacterium]|nr:NAD(P)(+) transhydrogenase (Re/Si-specific) subunit beta [Leptospiraceae bacterium]MCP5511625.1 NAD(P)(+) transhydrogenase (Re/Si-specific) subunit beta [Leptospiraceae bacterium]